jgi:hypothetical protein
MTIQDDATQETRENKTQPIIGGTNSSFHWQPHMLDKLQNSRAQMKVDNLYWISIPIK